MEHDNLKALAIVYEGLTIYTEWFEFLIVVLRNQILWEQTCLNELSDQIVNILAVELGSIINTCRLARCRFESTIHIKGFGFRWI